MQAPIKHLTTKHQLALTLHSADVTIMCGCIKEATGTMTHACHVPSRAKPPCLEASMSTVIFCQELIVQVQVSCNTMAASVGTVSTYVLFMYPLRLHSLEYSTYMYTLAKAFRLVEGSK